MEKINLKNITILLIVMSQTASCLSVSYGKSDLVLEGVYEAALDLPRIYFLLKRTANGPPIKYDGNFELSCAFLDTGASGILLSKETTELMNITIEPNACFADIGVGGTEIFDVSEPLYIGVAGYGVQDPYNTNIYMLRGPGRFQVKNSPADLLSGPIDALGMPVMNGRIAVLNPDTTNELEYFAADIKMPDDPKIPKTDIEIKLSFRQFVDPNNSENTPPLPVWAPNPVIENIEIYHDENRSTGTWLLDTGGTISLISTAQAANLKLVDKNGKPLAEVAFELPIGGVGNMVQIYGFEVDKLAVPTLSGSNLLFKNARLGVHDIKYYDKKSDKFVTLDGVFGCNFLCASAKMDGILPSDISETIFDNIVIDMKKGILGFGLKENPKNENKHSQQDTIF